MTDLVRRSSQYKISVTYKFNACNLQKEQYVSSTKLQRKEEKKTTAKDRPSLNDQSVLTRFVLKDDQRERQLYQFHP